ncbi:MAG TPA: D-alanine--D-alanine ligase family protein [Bryobacteraceae bacterium]|nr:D-alanine--D-alanine ligase family protein [Bryobacteraceae bacterium]
MNSNTNKKLRVAIIFGGRSGEHEISLRSATSVKKALHSDKYEIHEYFIDKSGKWNPAPFTPEPGMNPDIDVVIPMLHGTFGEDGSIQGLLELADLPYVGAGVLASAISMDKSVTKRLCKEAGLPVVEHVVLTRGHFDPQSVTLPFPFPAFVKPANLGSSVGISKAKNAKELQSALETASQYDRKIVVERGVQGREFECAVLGGNPPTATMPCEIIPSEEFYTYDDKYLLDKARIELPAKLSGPQTEEVKRLSIECFEAVGCEGMARVDFLMDASSGQFFVNEINTIPGFTSISMFPKMWEYSGVEYSNLLDRLIQLALERAEARRQLQYSR